MSSAAREATLYGGTMHIIMRHCSQKTFSGGDVHVAPIGRNSSLSDSTKTPAVHVSLLPFIAEDTAKSNVLTTSLASVRLVMFDNVDVSLPCLHDKVGKALMWCQVSVGTTLPLYLKLHVRLMTSCPGEQATSVGMIPSVLALVEQNTWSETNQVVHVSS